MARLPKRLAGPMLVDSTAETVYTVPASTNTVIRNIRVNNPTAGVGTFTLSIGVDATATRLIAAVPIAAGSYMDIFLYQVLAATNTIQASSSLDDQLVMTISGDEYT